MNKRNKNNQDLRPKTEYKTRVPSKRLNIGTDGEPLRGTPSSKMLGRYLKYYEVPIDPVHRGSLWRYHTLLREWNHDSDLTRLHSFTSMVERHYVDCLWLPVHLIKDWPSPLLDVGTGAGLPGIVLAIQLPHIQFILAEPRPRRVEFLQHVVKDLALKNVEIFPHKVTSASFTTPIKGCICRAFSSIEDTLPRISGVLPKNGKMFFMKGPSVQEELEKFKSDEFVLEKEDFYTLPHTTQKRSLVILKKL